MKTIVLNGISWDTENLEVNGETHFTYEEAKIEATKLGKRLPTKREFSKLLKLPHSWDNLKKGMWFAEREEDLKTDKSLKKDIIKQLRLFTIKNEYKFDSNEFSILDLEKI